MAVSLSSAEVVPASLKCSICLELFSDPHVLSCLHMYCVKCLQGLVSDWKSELSDRKINKMHLTYIFCNYWV